MMFKLFHAMTRETRFTHKPENFKIHHREEFEHIANITCESLEQAFELSSNTYRPWCENPEVQIVNGNKHRSTSVGDVLMDESGSFYMAAPAGFTKI
jgi:hypothetical protein